MPIYRFSKGEKFYWKGQQFVVNALRAGNQVEFENIETGAILNLM